MFAAPIFLTIIAALVFREAVGPRQWSAVIAGFVGVVIIAAPGGEGWSAAALLPLLAAAIMAFRDMFTRYIPIRTNALSIALITGVAVTLAGLFSLPFGWAPVDLADRAGLVACALLLSLAMVLIVGAVRTGELSFVAPFRYVSIVLAVTYGAALGRGAGHQCLDRRRDYSRRGPVHFLSREASGPPGTGDLGADIRIAG